MSDSDPEKKSGTRSWQHSPAHGPTKMEPAPDQELAEAEPPPAQEAHSDESVLAQARKFLEEDEVRDASTEKKIAFLQSKGLSNDNIQSLLGRSRDVEASNLESSESTPPSPPKTNLPSSPPPQSTFSALSQPPIITYPEFLTTPSHPTPLVTKPRLLTTLYLFSGLTALLYGTHEYLLTPMLASLTTARLSLAASSKSNLEKLITQLESVVSEIPSHTTGRETEMEQTDSDEDPTELFHRDIGVQTSAPSSRLSSPHPSSSSALDSQISTLGTMKTSLGEMLTTARAEGYETAEVEGAMIILKDYLESIAYAPPTYGFMSGYPNGRKEEDDEIMRVKREIRGVKGTLLSARSFPGAGSAAGVKVPHGGG